MQKEKWARKRIFKSKQPQQSTLERTKTHSNRSSPKQQQQRVEQNGRPARVHRGHGLEQVEQDAVAEAGAQRGQVARRDGACPAGQHAQLVRVDDSQHVAREWSQYLSSE